LGLDNIAELLTMSPLMMDKYIDAAESILDGAFPSEVLATTAFDVKVLRSKVDAVRLVPQLNGSDRFRAGRFQRDGDVSR